MTAIRVGSYHVQISNIGKTLPALLKEDYSKVTLLTDLNTKKACYPTFLDLTLIEPEVLIEIDPGELSKTLKSCEYIWKSMLENGMDRKSLLILLGGGMVNDLGGFCASTYMRGVDFVMVPTTLLAQVDASIGGKLGIDYLGYKNLLGLFHDPKEVFLEFSFLESLPQREINSGYVEILKHIMIASPAMWEKVKEKNVPPVIELQPYIEKSLIIKKQIIETDPFEKGLRKILNFGHTLGHAFESLYLQEETNPLHGECIAAGIICEAYISQKVFEFEESLLEEIVGVLKPFARNVRLHQSQFEHVLNNIKKDKKSEAGIVYFSLIKDIGNARYNVQVPNSLLRESMNYYIELMN
jgi:3-dehydroquinate synthase